MKQRITVVESDSSTVFFADGFRLGKGFIFPYGSLDVSGPFGADIPFAGRESEDHASASDGLDLINQHSGARGFSVRKPELKDIAYILSFIASIGDGEIDAKFMNFFCANKFFGFEGSFLFPGKGVVVIERDMIPELAKRDLSTLNYFDIKDPRVKIFPHSSGGTKENRQRFTLEKVCKDSGLLGRLIGKQGVGDLISLLRGCAPVSVGSLGELAKAVVTLPHFYGDIQLEYLQADISTDFPDSYPKGSIIRGVPYVTIESTKGLEPESGTSTYDRVNVVHDFWVHKPFEPPTGYTFGIIE